MFSEALASFIILLYLQNVALFLTGLNDCAAGMKKCSANADCVNMSHSAFCRCKKGFSGNGMKCEGTYTPKWRHSVTADEAHLLWKLHPYGIFFLGFG